MTDAERTALRALLAAKEDQYDSEGDDWIYRPDPDSAFLAVDALAVSLERFIDSLKSDAPPTQNAKETL